MNNTFGGQNTAIGWDALSNNTTGVGNTALGHGAGSLVTTANNVISILATFQGRHQADRSGQ